MNICFIGGGNMASALVGGLLKRGFASGNLRVIEPNIRYFVAHGAKGVFMQAAGNATGAELSDLRNYTPVNRLSIGIQSFNDEDLRWMNRAHHAEEAHACLRRSLAAGLV